MNRVTYQQQNIFSIDTIYIVVEFLMLFRKYHLDGILIDPMVKNTKTFLSQKKTKSKQKSMIYDVEKCIASKECFT